jgi:predicted AlkP superfamily phosphohydrolase/phosphomutase
MSATGNVEVLLIGIDAGCLPVFERLFEESRLPAIESICSEGVCAPLESQIPPWTPSAWPSLFTGVNPGEHGVYNFLDFEGYDFRVVTAADVRAHRLWTLLDSHDRSSVVVNVPVTSPPDEINGAVVPGFIGPEDPPCHPEGILEDIRTEIGDYRVYPQYSRDDDSYTDEEKLAEYRNLVGMRGEAFRYLADRFEPDFGFIQFQRTDTVFHEFDGEWEYVQDVYEATDDQIGQILEECDPGRVFIASDHGIGRYEKEEFHVNSFLRDEGYVEITQGGQGMPTWNLMRDELREGEQTQTWEPGTAEKLAAALAKVGITTHRIGLVLEWLGLDEIAMRYAPAGVVRTGNEQVDFPNSTAYLRTRTELGIRINLAGREPNGTVPEEEYERVRTELIDRLSSVTAPNDEPVFEAVEPREEYFHGPETEHIADIITIPNDFQHFLSAEPFEEWFGESTEPWNHKLSGVFAASGQDIDADADLTDAHLFDVAPTILAALGAPADENMDGDVLPVVSDSGTQAYPAYAPADAAAVDADVEDRLADLGYME